MAYLVHVVMTTSQPQGPQRNTTFGMRISTETQRQMKRLAAIKGMSVSKTITHLVEKELEHVDSGHVSAPAKLSVSELQALSPQERHTYLTQQMKLYTQYHEYIPGGEELIESSDQELQ